MNPVFLLDEVDKMSVDFRAIPRRRFSSSRPGTEQGFNDHYLEIDLDSRASCSSRRPTRQRAFRGAP